MSLDLLTLFQSMGYFAKGIVVVLAVMSIWSLTIMIQKFIQFKRAQAENTGSSSGRAAPAKAAGAK